MPAVSAKTRAQVEARRRTDGDPGDTRWVSLLTCIRCTRTEHQHGFKPKILTHASTFTRRF